MDNLNKRIKRCLNLVESMSITCRGFKMTTEPKPDDDDVLLTSTLVEARKRIEELEARPRLEGLELARDTYKEALKEIGEETRIGGDIFGRYMLHSGLDMWRIAHRALCKIKDAIGAIK